MRNLLYAATAITALALTPAAHATVMSIGLQTTGGIVTEATNSGVGAINFSGGFGAWTVNLIQAADQTTLSGDGVLDSSSLDIKSILTAAGTLKVYITSQGLTGEAALEAFTSSFTSNTLSGSVTSVTMQTFVDDANGQYALTTPLNSHNFTAIGTNVGNADAALTGTYSATEVYTINADIGTGTANSTIDLSGTAVPEPASIALLGFGLLGVGFVANRKRSV